MTVILEEYPGFRFTVSRPEAGAIEALADDPDRIVIAVDRIGPVKPEARQSTR